MQNKTQHFIGIDVSKPFFDAALMSVIDHQKQSIESAHFENTELGLKAFEKWLKSHKVSFDQNTILVIENTGIYRSGEPSPLTLGILQQNRASNTHWQCCSHQVEFWHSQRQK